MCCGAGGDVVWCRWGSILAQVGKYSGAGGANGCGPAPWEGVGGRSAVQVPPGKSHLRHQTGTPAPKMEGPAPENGRTCARRRGTCARRRGTCAMEGRRWPICGAGPPRKITPAPPDGDTCAKDGRTCAGKREDLRQETGAPAPGDGDTCARRKSADTKKGSVPEGTDPKRESVKITGRQGHGRQPSP